jgi:hypothetical protein
VFVGLSPRERLRQRYRSTQPTDFQRFKSFVRQSGLAQAHSRHKDLSTLIRYIDPPSICQISYSASTQHFLTAEIYDQRQIQENTQLYCSRSRLNLD